MFRERVAVAFITLSLAATGGFGWAVVHDLNQPRNATAQLVPDQGGVDTGGGATPSPTASAAYTGAATGGSSVAAAAASKLASTQAASGVTGDTMTIGMFYDTKVVDATVERDTVKSYFLANGPINGRRVQVVTCDSQYDSVQTQNCAREMVAQHVLALVGVTAPKGENDVVKFLTQDEGIPWVGGLGTPEEYKYPLAYPVSPSFAFSGTPLAAEFKLNQKTSPYFRHPAILYISDVPWVAPVVDAITAALKAQGIVPTTIEPATSTDGDYAGHVANLKYKNDQGPCAPASENTDGGACSDSIIAATDPFSYAKLFTAMDRIQWHPPIVAGGLDKGNQQSAYGDQLGCANCGQGLQPRQAQSLTPFASPLDPAEAGNKTVQAYLGAVKRFYPNQYEALDVYTQIAWTASMVFAEAAKDAGQNLTRQSLANALNQLRNFNTGWSTPISYSPGSSHDPNHCYYYLKHDPKSFDQGGTWRESSGLQCF